MVSRITTQCSFGFFDGEAGSPFPELCLAFAALGGQVRCVGTRPAAPLACSSSGLRWLRVNRRRADSRQILISSIKGEVKRKHITFGWSFSCFAAHLSRICSDLPHHVLGCGALRPRGLDFLYQRFSLLLRDEACQFRNQQSRTVVKFGDHSSIGDSWPIAFSGYPRRPRVL
jgi:hypothetical protein